MTLAIPAALLCLLTVAATIRWAGHKAAHALAAFLAGFLTAATPAAPFIRAALTSLAHAAHIG